MNKKQSRMSHHNGQDKRNKRGFTIKAQYIGHYDNVLLCPYVECPFRGKTHTHITQLPE